MENVLGSLDGVVDSKADFVKGIATVSYDPARVTSAQMVEAINTQTLYQASLPEAKGTVAEATPASNTPVRYSIWGVVAVVLLGAGWWLARGRLGLKPGVGD